MKFDKTMALSLALFSTSMSTFALEIEYGDWAESGAARTVKIDTIILHSTGGPSCVNNKLAHTEAGSATGNLSWFKEKDNISIHYIIGKDGKIYGSVPTNQVAWHAGPEHNPSSIGIELINKGNGNDPFPPAQLDSLVSLLNQLLEQYELSAASLKSHSEIDTDKSGEHRAFTCGGKEYKRKVDPGGFENNFPWDAVRGKLAS